jgi:hypothetical protein
MKTNYMQHPTSFFSEKHMLFIQKMLKVSRRELIETIKHSCISAENIANYLRKKNLGFKNLQNPDSKWSI